MGSSRKLKLVASTMESHLCCGLPELLDLASYSEPASMIGLAVNSRLAVDSIELEHGCRRNYAGVPSVIFQLSAINLIGAPV